MSENRKQSLEMAVGLAANGRIRSDEVLDFANQFEEFLDS